MYSEENPRQFSIEQWRTGLGLRSPAPGDPIRTGGAPCYTDGVFTPGQPVFITITSGDFGTKVYVDGALRKVTPAFRISNKILTGKLVAGSGALSAYDWWGQVRGLAVYGRTLSSTEVLRNYANWMSKGRPEISDLEALLALYLFDEGAGSRIHNKVPGGSDLHMPDRFLVPAKSFLSTPSLENPEDIIANIMGFVPLGFTLCGYFSSTRRMPQAIVIVTVICGALSLIIESLQYFLPTRDSSMTDVITNFLGGGIGSLLYCWGRNALVQKRVNKMAREGILN